MAVRLRVVSVKHRQECLLTALMLVVCMLVSHSAILPLQVTETPLSELFTTATADVIQTPHDAALPARTLKLTGCKRLPLNLLPGSCNTVEGDAPAGGGRE